MPVTLKELPGTRSGDSSIDNEGRVRRVYERQFRLESPDEISVYEAGLLFGLDLYAPHAQDPPLLANSHGNGDPYAFAQAIRCQDEGHRAPWRFLFTARYSNDLPEQRDDNPFNEPVEVRIDGESSTRILVRDINGDALANAAGDLYDPPVEAPYPVIRVSYVRNQTSFNIATILQYQLRLNDSTFLGAPRGAVQCTKIGAERKVRGNWVYWPHTYEFLIDAVNGFQPRILNAGYREKVSVGGQDRLVAIYDGDNNPVSSPWPLDNDGAALPGDSVSPSAWIQNEHETYPYAEFNNLGLPT